VAHSYAVALRTLAAWLCSLLGSRVPLGFRTCASHSRAKAPLGGADLRIVPCFVLGWLGFALCVSLCAILMMVLLAL
jgi:hypothetical protein